MSTLVVSPLPLVLQFLVRCGLANLVADFKRTLDFLLVVLLLVLAVLQLLLRAVLLLLVSRHHMLLFLHLVGFRRLLHLGWLVPCPFLL